MFSVPSISSGRTPLSITNSVRFRASASPYFSRSTWGTPTDAKKCTISFWLKRPNFGTQAALFYSNSGNPVGSGLILLAGDTLAHYHGGAANNETVPTAMLRDDSGWYHIFWVIDTTQATAADRVRCWYNGVEQTSWVATNYPALNASHQYTTNAIATYIGGLGGNYGDHYLAEFHFIDGTVKDVGDFGQFNSYGQWEAIAYAGGSYGTNGFYLDFSDGSAASSSALGKDRSGNNNDFTPTNISVTAGTGNDFLQDTPTTNYPILTTLAAVNSSVVQKAGMAVTTASSGAGGVRTSIALPKTGKWYYEQTIGTITGSAYAGAGLWRNNGNADDHYGSGANGLGYSGFDGNKFTYSSSAAYGNTFTTNDIIGVAVDCDNDKVWFSKNGTWQASGDPAAGTNPAFSGQGVNSADYDWFPVVFDNATGTTVVNDVNFGQRAFNTTPPTGFSALCVASFPTPTIEYPTDYVNVKQYSGTGSSQGITF